ncbi:MAG: hypothetical protein J6M16_10610 [Clostridia bacterium]|nr:hypothetical protein [Clostridia bacterium]
MKRLIKMELKKAICSKFFLLGVLLLTLFSVLSAVYMIENRINYNPNTIEKYILTDGNYKTNPDVSLYSFFNSWLGGEELSLAGSLFFSLMPVGCAIPYAWSYYTEKKSGYLKNVASRENKRKYILAKTLAVFVSGALTVLIPMVLNVFLVSAFVPDVMPFAGYTLYNHIYFGDLWVDFYYTFPYLYVLFYLLLDVLYGGIYALLSLAVSCFYQNLLSVLFLPFITMVAVNYLKGLFDQLYMSNVIYKINPMGFLHSLSSGGTRAWWIILLVTVLLLATSLLIIFIKGFKDEIF